MSAAREIPAPSSTAVVPVTANVLASGTTGSTPGSGTAPAIAPVTTPRA